jgi:hypothetical protein
MHFSKALSAISEIRLKKLRLISELKHKVAFLLFNYRKGLCFA